MLSTPFPIIAGKTGWFCNSSSTSPNVAVPIRGGISVSPDHYRHINVPAKESLLLPTETKSQTLSFGVLAFGLNLDQGHGALHWHLRLRWVIGAIAVRTTGAKLPASFHLVGIH